MRKWFAILCSVLLLSAVPLPVSAEQQPAVLLIEANTGCILSEESADVIVQPGSFSKLMTALLTAQAMERGELTADTLLTAGESVRGMRGAVIWLEPGDSLRTEELLTALLVGNAGDAAAVLADSISGSAEQFVMDMNAAAFDLGMRDTHFTSPQGFDDPGSFTTAHDLGLLACAVLRCGLLTSYLTTWRTFVKDGAVELVNENSLTRTYDGCRGVKASHADGRYSLIAAAQRNGMLLCAVVLDCGDSDQRFSLAKELLKKGFSGYKLSAPGYSEEFLLPLRVRGGTEQAVLLQLSQLPVLAVPQKAELSSVTVLPEFRQAPVLKGTKVGQVYFYHEDTLLAEAELVAADDVREMRFADAWAKMRHFLFS
ncbi:MAG: D-alanyl-D-alanine carboxypeptidase [Oscillospiraceae bacterium]|nr:D-alanyl-D-alanine carboxypeptidase [Oscillospiraceae bacterium]